MWTTGGCGENFLGRGVSAGHAPINQSLSDQRLRLLTMFTIAFFISFALLVLVFLLPMKFLVTV